MQSSQEYNAPLPCIVYKLPLSHCKKGIFLGYEKLLLEGMQFLLYTKPKTSKPPCNAQLTDRYPHFAIELAQA